jgi:hypothetical protein
MKQWLLVAVPAGYVDYAMPLIINMSVKKIGTLLNLLSCLPKESR